MRPLTIRYDVPGVTPHGELLEEVVLRPTLSANGVAFIIDPTVRVSQQTCETVAHFTRRIADELSLCARSLTVRFATHSRQRVQKGHDCSPEGDAVLDFTLDRQWEFNLRIALLRAGDLLSGRFPSMHASALVPWIDAVWTLSLDGRLATRGVLRKRIEPDRAATSASADQIALNELLRALIWAGKSRGLSLQMVEASRIAGAVWGRDVSLHEVVALGGKYGFRPEGPLSSIPLPELWPRSTSGTSGLHATQLTTNRVAGSS